MVFLFPPFLCSRTLAIVKIVQLQSASHPMRLSSSPFMHIALFHHHESHRSVLDPGHCWMPSLPLFPWLGWISDSHARQETPSTRPTRLTTLLSPPCCPLPFRPCPLFFPRFFSGFLLPPFPVPLPGAILLPRFDRSCDLPSY